MSHPACLPRPVPLVRPLPQRWFAAVVDGLKAVGRAVRPWLSRPVVVGYPLISAQVFASLDDRTLRDIGVPDPLRAEAEVHRGADALTLASKRREVQDSWPGGW